MTNERYRQLSEDQDSKLTDEEVKEGWHFCPDFDFLLTQGELFNDDGVTCICGFNKNNT
jgi:hypothetical protein